MPTVGDGVRIVRMVRREAIPRHMSIGDVRVKIAYAGQQQVCDLCAAPGHIARVCPLKGKCFQCGLEGHLSRNCPQRAGYQARDDVEDVVPDPTPAEAAARASGAPRAEADEDLRDNQLDELSQSILAPVLAGVPPVGSSLPADDASVDSIDLDCPAHGISNVTHVDNVDSTVVNNEVVNNKVNENLVNNDVVGNNVNNNSSNAVNNDLVINDSIVNNNLVVNESTVNNNVVEINGNNNVEISTSEISVASQNSSEVPNFLPVSDSVNIFYPGSSPLCASSLDGGSSELFSSGVSDAVVKGASDSRKRAHAEVSSDGDSVDSSHATVVKSKLPVRKQKGVRKPPAPAPPAATPRATRSSSLIPGLSRGLKLAAAEWGRLAKRL